MLAHLAEGLEHLSQPAVRREYKAAYRVDPVEAHIRRGLLHRVSRCHSAAFSDFDELPTRTVGQKVKDRRR